MDIVLQENFIFIVLFIILVFIFLIIQPLQFTTNPPKLLQEVVETMENIEIEASKLNINPSSGFCESHLGKSADLESSCNRLTKNRCMQTTCCVFTNKCSAGSIHGPTYKKDKNGELITMDYYYYQDKCFGKNCPK